MPRFCKYLYLQAIALSLSMVAFAQAPATLSTNVGLHLKTECKESTCKTFSCYGRFEVIEEEPGLREIGLFDTCGESDHRAMAECKAEDLEDRRYRVGSEDQMFSVCRSFDENYTPLVQAMLAVERTFGIAVQNFTSASAPAYAAFVNGKPTIRFTQSYFGRLYGDNPLVHEIAMLTACHEIGHFLGGEPTMVDLEFNRFSAEGQADYYAASACLAQFWDPASNQEFVRKFTIPASISAICSKRYTDPNDYNLCARKIYAGFAFERTLYPTVDPATPSTKVVERSIVSIGSYPEPQCRLDTVIAGATGLARPLCWFRP